MTLLLPKGFRNIFGVYYSSHHIHHSFILSFCHTILLRHIFDCQLVFYTTFHQTIMTNKIFSASVSSQNFNKVASLLLYVILKFFKCIICIKFVFQKIHLGLPTEIINESNKIFTTTIERNFNCA